MSLFFNSELTMWLFAGWSRWEKPSCQGCYLWACRSSWT